MINELYQDKLSLHQELLKQAKMIEKAEKCQKERNKIIVDNEKLYNEVDNIKAEYKLRKLE